MIFALAAYIAALSLRTAAAVALRKPMPFAELDALVFHSHKVNAEKQFVPSDQLRCVGTHCGRTMPYVVECFNKGLVENSSAVRWECDTDVGWNRGFIVRNITCAGVRDNTDLVRDTDQCVLTYELTVLDDIAEREAKVALWGFLGLFAAILLLLGSAMFCDSVWLKRVFFCFGGKNRALD